MNETISAVIDTYVKYISSLDGVLQIYLFGSHAKCTAHEHSDIDLMVIVDDRIDRVKASVNISRGLSKRTVPLDVLVNRKTDFLNASIGPTLQNLIKSEGVLMYGAE